MKSNVLLAIIIIFGFLIRIIGVDLVPPSLNWDEVSHGYNAYSILKTGKDEWGQTLPLIFRAYGDYKLPVYIYTAVPNIALFGLTPIGVRLPSIIAGTISIFLIYLLSKRLFSEQKESEKISLWSAFLFAVIPWSLFISRIAVEANLALALILAGIYFFPKKLLFSSLFLGLSVWTYNSSRVFVPFLIIGMCVIYRNELFLVYKKHRTSFIFSTILILIFLIPMFFQLINPIGTARYKELQILDQGAIAHIEESRNNSELPPILNRLINNKFVYFGSTAGTQYISHFLPGFLFFTGGDHYQFSVPNRGLIYFVLIPFLLFGFWLLIKNIRSPNYQFILFWLIIAPIASSITRDSPHVLRSTILLPVLLLIISLGLSKLKELGTLLMFILIVLFFGSYMYSYSTTYKDNYSWAWQYGYKDVANYAKQNYDNYDQIIMTKKYGEPHEFVLFYNQWNPKLYQNDENLKRFNQSNWWWVDGFDKFKFINDWQVKDLKLESGESIDCENRRCLLITSPGNFPANWDKLENINFLDGNPAFELYEN